MKKVTVKIKDGWLEAGKAGEALGQAINVYGVFWTPVLWYGDEDPDFYKTNGLDYL